MRELYVVRSMSLLLCVGCGMARQAVPSRSGLPRAPAPAVTSVREDSISVAVLEQRVETAAARRNSATLPTVGPFRKRLTRLDDMKGALFRYERRISGLGDAREIDIELTIL